MKADSHDSGVATPLEPSEVRNKILSDHVLLREELAAIEELARALLEGPSGNPTGLREKGEQFHATLAQHMAWEDQHLTPVLREIDAWGEERSQRLAEEHKKQREQLAEALRKLRDPHRAASEVARDLLELSSWLMQDMELEEKTTLDPNVLRDDVTGIDVEAG